MSDLTIRPAVEGDHDAIWRIFHAVVAPGDTYAFPPDIDRDSALAAWLVPGIDTFVAESADGVVGTYILKVNQAGPGDHVANCAYMVDPAARRRGIGRAM
ncbi:MAG: GNAT family N-acetyltransferase, partial [Halofilum sp. (in: g-proteobacteria)]